MYNYVEVDSLFEEWKRNGATKEELIVKTAEAEIGWPYVWGAVGAQCTPGNRKTYANRSSCPEGEVKEIYRTCQALTDSGESSGKSCGGCQYYPNNMRVLIDDCQGFVKQVCSRVGIKFTGGGATSMWNGSSNWEQKGTRDTLPEKLCCIFWQASDKKTMSHIGFYIGGGMMIHCSGKVKKEKISAKVTHWAIPKGLGGDTPMPTHSTIRRGSTGSDVVYCQELLIKLNYDLSPYGADGKFGAKTESAVKAFQKSQDLKADGIVGPMTWDALEKAAESPTELYTVTIPHLTLEQANQVTSTYPNATKVKE